jgi:hypothetical protein
MKTKELFVVINVKPRMKLMNIKIVYDQYENEYIAFVDGIPAMAGYGTTEKEAILDFLYKAKEEEGFNHRVIQTLIDKIEND